MSKIITSSIHRNIKSLNSVLITSRYSTEPTHVYKKKEDDYVTAVKYPPIEKLDQKTKDRREVQKFYDFIKRQNTIEEKFLAINFPRYYGWKCFVVEEDRVPYDGIDFIQHLTRTHLIKVDNLPNHYDKFNGKAAELSKQLKSNIEDLIAYQLDVRHKKPDKELSQLDKEKELTKIIIYEINKTILNNLSLDEWHLKNVQVDLSPRIEGFWQNKNIVETFVKKQNKDGIPIDKVSEEYEDRPSDKYFQYVGKNILQLRHREPLPPIIDIKDAIVFEYPVPKYDYDPHNLGFEIKRRHGTNVPGFWPGDEKDFSFLSYHDSNHVKHRPPTYGEIDAEETLQWQAISSSFGLLMAIANFQGFSTYHDVTYPISHQAILTDGRDFKFSNYQLNTTELYHDDFYENSKCNICWITPSQKLFETFENGKLQGFNEDVLKNIISFYLNEPKAPTGVELKPYLGKDIKFSAQYEDKDKSAWLEKRYKHIISNRPRHRTDHMYEVFDYERIFLIEHQTKPLRRKTRPFYFGEQPYHIKLDHYKEYIPNSVRRRKLPKYKPSYWPQ